MSKISENVKKKLAEKTELLVYDKIIIIFSIFVQQNYAKNVDVLALEYHSAFNNRILALNSSFFMKTNN